MKFSLATTECLPDTVFSSLSATSSPVCISPVTVTIASEIVASNLIGTIVAP